MIKLFAVFFQAIHRAEIVPLTVMPADDSVFLRYVNSANGVSVGLYAGIESSAGLCLRFFCRGQRE